LTSRSKKKGAKMRDVRSIYQYVFLASIVILSKPEEERGATKGKRSSGQGLHVKMWPKGQVESALAGII